MNRLRGIYEQRILLIGGLSFGCLCGIALSVVTGVSGLGLILVAVASAALVSTAKPVPVIAGAVVGGLVIGLWRGGAEQVRLAEVQSFVGSSVVLSGKVAADPEAEKNDRMKVRLAQLSINGKRVTGSADVTIPERAVARGDVLTLQGKLTRGFGSAQLKMQYPSAVSVERMNSPEIHVRDAFAASVRNHISEAEASLGLGFLLGQRSALPESLEEDFRLLGLTHIVVASGYNLTILVRAARRLLQRVSRFQVTAISIGLVSLFVIVTGFSSSMTRAALVTLLAVWAWHFGRTIHPIVILLFAAALTALFNPFYVWADIGWYLSFFAFAGVLILAPLVKERLYGEKEPALVVQVCIETLCAQLLTLPIILLLFGVMPVLSLLANVIVVPFIPLIMLLTFLAGMTSFALPAIAALIALPAEMLLSYIITVSTFLGDVAWASIELQFGVAAMVASYIIIATFTVILWRRTGYDFLKRSFIE